MRKKLLVLGLATVMAFSFTACSDNGKKVESEKNIEDTTEETTADESKTGEVVEENGIKKVPVITDKELNKKGKSGPVKYNLKAIQISKLTATTEDMATALDIEKNTEVSLVAIDVEIENTSKDTISFYPDQGKLTTNTKEQADVDMFFSDNIGGDLLGEVKKDGTIFFILKNTNADDINTITYHVDAPFDENLNTVGDEVKVELNFK